MHSKIVSQRYVLVLSDDISDKASMNLKSFQIYKEIITALYHATCIKQCVSNVLKMVCRKYFDTYYISLSSNETETRWKFYF